MLDKANALVTNAWCFHYRVLRNKEVAHIKCACLKRAMWFNVYSDKRLPFRRKQPEWFKTIKAVYFFYSYMLLPL